VTAQKIETEFAGRPIVLETGRMARQASGSAALRFGDTMVLAAVTVSQNVSSLPFFPLTVEYREKTYAAGKIPGGFLKREGRPSDKEILASRLIDRSIRPLFPEGFKNEVQVFVTVLSADQENDADVLGVVAAAAALGLSAVPWNGPLAAVRVGRVEGNWILNPTFQQLEFSSVDLVVSGSADSIVMVEGGSLEISEAEIIEALKVAQKGIRELLGLQKQLIDKAGPVQKLKWTRAESDSVLLAKVRQLAEEAMAQAINAKDKASRSSGVKAVKEQILQSLLVEYAERGRDIAEELEEIEYRVMRKQVLERSERVDGRDLDTIRPISIETGVLARTHGSALFTRGQTQALVSVTLGTSDDEQRIDSIDVAGETTKSFMLHYNFPPYATGEVKMMRGTSRREIGHGALAETAAAPALRGFPLYPPSGLRDPGVQRLLINGERLRRIPGSDGCRRADEGPLRRCGYGPDQGRRQGRYPDRHSGLGRPPRRHGLQGGRHREGNHVDSDGHQDPGTRAQDHGAGSGAGPQGPAAHPEGDGQDSAGPPHRSVAVRASHLHDADQAGQDRRCDRSEGQDDPRHSGRHRRQDQHRGHRSRHHLRRWRRSG
jgi:polyribonucleotide nucleotidyltransferase